MPALSMLAILFLLNLLSVKMFGEAEFWFALIKVITIIALIGTGGWMIATGWTSPDGVTASLSHLTDPTAFMPHGITGFFAGFQIAIFSFTGIELLGTMTAGDPRSAAHFAQGDQCSAAADYHLLSAVDGGDHRCRLVAGGVGGRPAPS
ncbi:D-serine/D-alanine/glycine transporter [Klebsiella pneumoniae subsp. ozaenae]|uniref:D-serine/D-alanine/glycine transporter n=1 Tax=Klebsiella pneumoniae subsp. ozaenae TaxID=574 RepID=A0A378B180_KLEPO|nr:D-serine/D-alanine/glycine transporter [Klebsiella pneumoniae subsp. ozaenae]